MAGAEEKNRACHFFLDRYSARRRAPLVASRKLMRCTASAARSRLFVDKTFRVLIATLIARERAAESDPKSGCMKAA